MSNNNDWKNQYQTYEQAQNMNNFFQFQQNMFENMMKMTEQNQFNVQGGANNNINNNPFNQPQPKNEYINLCFATVQGSRIMMKIKPDDTVEKVLEKYLLRVNLPELINNVQGKITFILSAQSLKFGDKRKIKDVAVMTSLNQVLVNDTGNLIGAI